MITLDKPFASLEEMFKTLKGMSANDVIELAKALGVEWKECPHHVGINRMRASMAMREKFFPGQRRKRKPQPWKKVPYEEMVKIAQEHGIKWKQTKDKRINRMHLTVALQKAGIEPPKKK